MLFLVSYELELRQTVRRTRTGGTYGLVEFGGPRKSGKPPKRIELESLAPISTYVLYKYSEARFFLDNLGMHPAS